MPGMGWNPPGCGAGIFGGGKNPPGRGVGMPGMGWNPPGCGVDMIGGGKGPPGCGVGWNPPDCGVGTIGGGKGPPGCGVGMYGMGTVATGADQVRPAGGALAAAAAIFRRLFKRGIAIVSTIKSRPAAARPPPGSQ